MDHAILGHVTGSPKSHRASSTRLDRVAAQLTAWPGLQGGRPACGAGTGFSFGGAQILHLHTNEEADLRLTRPVIGRLDEVLAGSGQVVTRGNEEDWVTVRLDTDTGCALLMTLVSVAIQATSDPPVGSLTRSGAPCSWERTRPRPRARLRTPLLGSMIRR